MRDRNALRTSVFDSLEEQIAVIDETGVIVDVNIAWKKFGVENGLSSRFSSVGSNYVDVTLASASSGDSLASEAAHGLLEILSGKRASFYFEYPCHSPEVKRWFMMRVTRLKDAAMSLFVISHCNITTRKLAEEKVAYFAMHDPLTGVANRRYFNKFLNNEMRRSIRSRSAISLILADIDYFKNYNDELGHPAGDRCLVNVGQALLRFSRRPGDLAARLGGDEFALVLGATGFAVSTKIADSVRKAMSNLHLVNGKSKQITVSVGVAAVIPTTQQTEEFLLQEADDALYRAKMAGRNQVVYAQPDTKKSA